jgi:FtsH-binding integral membrane protein
MASVSHTAIVRPGSSIAGRNGLVDKYFYFTMSLLTAAVVIWGFSHTVDQKLFHPAVKPPTLVWFHGAAFSLWVAFFIFQSALVRTRNVKLHRSLGWFGAGLGTVMVPLGITTSVVMARFDAYTLKMPGVDAFLIIGFYDMIAFGTCVALAILWRRKPDLHRRLLFIATCGLLDAAFGRIDYIFLNSLFYLCVDGMIALGAVRDLIVDKRIHKVYLVALPILAVGQYVTNYTWHAASSWWIAIAHSLMG